MQLNAPANGPSPLRLLGMAALMLVVLAQLAGVFLLARTQVTKAEQRALEERSARWQAVHCMNARGPKNACAMRPPSVGDSGLITASFEPTADRR